MAAAVTCLVWFFALKDSFQPWLVVFVVLAITFSGVWSGNELEKQWGKDSSRIVVDEVAGMAIGLLFVPTGWPFLLVAFILFRFFDISKILYIKKMERFPGGWGVMGDDVLAGIYTNVVMQLIVYCGLL